MAHQPLIALQNVIHYLAEAEREDWRRHVQEGEDRYEHIYADIIALRALNRTLMRQACDPEKSA
jgi:hypothetical protein